MAAASGRQYPNLRRLFAPVGGDMLYICENGALTMYHGERLSSTPVPRELGCALMRDILDQPDCEVLLSGRETSYILPRRRDYADFIVYTLRNTTTVVDDLFSVEEEFLKIAAYVHGNGAARRAPYFIEKWGKRLNVAVSGGEWVDFTCADKGAAIGEIQRRFGFAREEMMAFGDNFNDAQMLAAVGHSYVMDTADEALKKLCAHQCARPEDVMRALLDA